ncbi:MAG TPA: ABC transporter substrate-binding protein [Methanocorpusculum sp.]|nr:ABC transporter substrate-binding protein [Methanocorpusculum sp.]
MKLKLFCAALLALLICSGAACAAFPVTVTDSAGYTVTVTEQPKTIISLAPANTEIVYALGAGDKVVGDTDYCNYPEEAKSVAKIGGFSTISVEKITSLNPDIIFANDNNGLANIEQLKNLGFTVVVINPTSIDAIYSSIDLVGKCIGETDAAKQVIADMKTRIKAVSEKAAAAKTTPSVTHVMSVNPYWISGKNTFQDELITLAGGKNAFPDIDGWNAVTLEKFIVANPDFILTDPGAEMGDFGTNSLRDSFYEDSRLATVSAVKSRQVVVIDADTFDRGGPRAADALEELAKVLHPEIFGEHAESTKAAASPGFGAELLFAGLGAALLLRRK